MASRKIPLVTGEIYHVFNRSVGQQPIFNRNQDYDRFLQLLDFYRFNDHHLRFSHYSRLERKLRAKYIDAFYLLHGQIEIHAFCIMPNHFHLLLKQIKESGISNFMRFIQDSYAKYVNLKNDRFGSLFQSPFKSVRIESEDQLLHVFRYIHLNPLTSYLVSNPKKLEEYPWASYRDYLSKYSRPFVTTHLLRSFFESKESIQSFTEDQIDYQRELGKIKHLTFEHMKK